MEKEEKLKEIIKWAHTLKWVFPATTIKGSDAQDFYSSYPLMIMSEVEKCMLAMLDDEYYERMKKWYEESISSPRVK